jgi:hypothetical protein
MLKCEHNQDSIQKEVGNMNIEKWSLKTVISGNFELVSIELLKTSFPPDKSIQKVIIDPIFDENNRQTGTFNLDIIFLFPFPQEKTSPDEIVNFGKLLINYYLGLLTFLSGQLVAVIKQPTFFFEIPDSKKQRVLIPSDLVFITPPILLKNTSVFCLKIEKRIWEIMYLIQQGLRINEVIASYLLLFSALELLANQFDFDDEIIDRCEKCGYEKRIRSGSKKKIAALLIDTLGFTDQLFQDMWDTRNKISHGGFGFSEEDRRKLYSLRGQLFVACQKGIKAKLNLEEKDLPGVFGTNPPFIDPILDLIISEPEK